MASMEEDKSDDETFLVSSDTESEYGDEKRLFYDDKTSADIQIKYILKAFDSDNGEGTNDNNMYQEVLLPMLKDKSHEFVKSLLNMELLSSNINCRNAKNDSKCAESGLEIILAFLISDKYQLRCKNCRQKESIRTNSIFEGVKCNLRSIIRILYGWVKGVEIDIMASILGLPKKTVGEVYNRASNVALGSMMLSPTLMEYGGADSLVLIDIFPMFLKKINPISQRCHPVLCVSMIETHPQKYWLEPLEPWDPNDEDQVNRAKSVVMDIITTLVKPGTILVLPNSSTIPLGDKIRDLELFYPIIKQMDDLLQYKDCDKRFEKILNTIWRRPMDTCEKAQFFEPRYMRQFFIRRMWVELTEGEALLMLISSIVSETRRGAVHQNDKLGWAQSIANKKLRRQMIRDHVILAVFDDVRDSVKMAVSQILHFLPKILSNKK